jgi:hypothetical protein
MKIRRQDNHRTGGVATNFERLSETKDLSALAHGNSTHPRAFKPFRRAFLEGSAKFGSSRPRNYHANHAIFPRVMIHLMAHMAHNGTCFPPPWRTCPACPGLPWGEVERGTSQAAKQFLEGGPFKPCFGLSGKRLRSRTIRWSATDHWDEEPQSEINLIKQRLKRAIEIHEAWEKQHG